MKGTFPIQFEYHRRQYFAIVRIRQREDNTQLKVRVLHARIDRLFYGYHIFNLKEHHIVPEEPPAGKAAELRNQVQYSIEQYLNG